MTSTSTGRKYRIKRVCQIWKICRSTLYNHRKEALPNHRRGPIGPCPDDDLVERIKSILKTSYFIGEGYRKVWARLRFENTRTSKERVRRLMRENNLQSTKRPKREHTHKIHDGRITTDSPDEMWGMDATSTITREEGTATIFIAVDHCTQECIGIHASKSGKTEQALEPLRQGVRYTFGNYDVKSASGLSIRHDHGSQYISKKFQSELRFLGITSTPSYVGEPQCNGVSERFIKMLKEQILHINCFKTVEDLRRALLTFKDVYNAGWLVQKHKYKTPNQVRNSFLTTKKVA